MGAEYHKMECKMTLQDNIHKNITQLVKERGMTMKQLESTIGVCEGYFVRIAEKQSGFNALPLIKACKILGVPIDEVVYK